MKIGDIHLGWFDLLFVALIVVGWFRGRKRGMTQEFPNLIQWIAIIGGGALLYKPLGELLSESTGMGRLFWFLMVYLLWAALVKAVTTWIVRSKGDKLGLADMFGSAEYPLGIASGMIRYALVCVFSLALLNARLYTSAELKSMAAYQQENFGNISLPTIGTVQKSVFLESALGKLMKDHAAFLLIEGTAPRAIKARPANKKGPKSAMDYWS
jgi:uncharacterized membrane protein required for colicin V production